MRRRRNTKRKSGDAGPPAKPGMYDNLLQFLDRVQPNTSTCSNLEEAEPVTSATATDEDVASQEGTEEVDAPSTSFGSSMPSSLVTAGRRKKRKSCDPVTEEILSQLRKLDEKEEQSATRPTTQLPDADDLFLQSITMEMKSLPPQQKTHFKIKVHELLFELKYNVQSFIVNEDNITEEFDV
ncbi:PREDICTED: uncharacterized protein LOC106819086 [Priapulus caudatus]|uniref:Uncharacterized protein LOC106819086 n=1 Tax=Priapulus caudatus TaxID=37621 RepID=A0ABM1F461_PRICU|nr:PREDICTED: uncharacterized protein LOC106819086 [Priapulus caudatus]